MFLLLFTLPVIIQVLWKNVYLAKNVSSTKNLPIEKIQSFLKSDVDLNQTCKIVLTQKHQIWDLNATETFFIIILFCYDQKFVFSEDLELKNQIKLDRTRKLWYLVLGSFSCYYKNRNLWYLFLRTFWLLLLKSNFWKADLALGYVFTQIQDSLIFHNFLRS